MIPATCLTTCEDNENEDNSRVALILGDKPVCGIKTLLMAPKIKLSSGYDMPTLGFGTHGVSWPGMILYSSITELGSIAAYRVSVLFGNSCCSRDRVSAF